jgi:hypothetical protein
MIILNPVMSPVRFYPYQNTADYQDNWPNMDNAIPGIENIKGVRPTKYYTDWIVGKQMSIQFWVVTEGNENLLLHKMDSTGIFPLYATISPVEITPLGWISEKINRYDFMFTEPGVYYFINPSSGYRSVKFTVHSSLKFKERLIQVEYFNSENDYGVVFFDNLTQRYSGLAYFTGQLILGTPGNTISAFHSDREDVKKLRATPVRMAILRLTDIHYADIDRINQIFSCDNIKVNGVSYQSDAVGSVSQKSALDVYDMDITLFQTDYNYFTL